MAANGKTLENDPLNRRGAFISWRWLAIAAFLIIALTAGILIAKKLRGSDVDRGTRALIEAFSKQRLIEPRLSGGFKGGEFRPSRDGAPDVKTRELERARGLIMDAVAKGEPGAELAYARLLLSEGEKLPLALKHLRRELVSSPDSAEPHNDLGVCLSLQGKLEDAIDEFDAALKQKADMPEALFNRALCYERLLLRDAASTEYSRLLTIEHEPGWLSEIKHRQERVYGSVVPQKEGDEIVAAFDSAIADRNIDLAQSIAVENFEAILKHTLLDLSVQYLERLAAGDATRAGQTMSVTEMVGRLFVESKGDSTTADLANHLRNLRGSEIETELGLMNEYRNAERMRNGPAAQVVFARLSGLFAEHGNYFFQAASTFYVVTRLYVSGHLTTATEMLTKSLRFIEGRQWPYLRAQLLCQFATIRSRLGMDSLAIKDCKQALKYGAGLSLLQAKALQFMGNADWHLGDLNNGLTHLQESTKLYLASVPSPTELANNWLAIAEIYRLLGNHSLALLFAKQAITSLNQAKDNSRAAQASAFIAIEHERLGQPDQAEKELRQAFDYLEKTEPGQRSSFTEPMVLTRAGEMAALLPDTARAVAYFSKAEALLEQGEEKTVRLMGVLRGRAEAYAKAKEFDKARLDLESAVGLIEGYRAGIADSADRRAFLDASQSVFDQLISLDVSVFGRQTEAFDFSEESRARTLLDALSSGKDVDRSKLASRKDRLNDSLRDKRVKSLRLGEVQAALPDDLRLLTYSVTRQRTYVFLVTRSSLEVAELPVTTETLDRLVEEYVSGLKAKAALDELSEQARQLYEYLIAPVEGRLGDGKALCIVPDKALHFLPFAALIDRAGEYLIKSYRLTYAPSASALVRCIEESRVKRESKNEKILAVGNPQFDRDAFPTLANLQDAEREASESAAYYPKSVILSGADATEVHLRAALKDCDVAHLAVHCLVDEKSPWLAALVLAKRTGVDQRLGSGSESSPVDGMLYLNEIYEISLPRARLVVLSACQSGLGQYYRGEGIVSLIHPFLAMRVPTVVASLWSVDSQATAALMVDFHRERKSTNPRAGDALRAAQIKMARSDAYAHPFYWAPFVAVGSNN